MLLSLIVNSASPVASLNSRLAVGDFLETSAETFHREFDAVHEEQLYILAEPINVYNRSIEQIKVSSILP